MKKVVVITGPTAVGKTKLSVEIAKYFNTDLINADAYQVYKEMNIGTAKVTAFEMQGIKHHLLSFLDSKDEFSISDYQKYVRNIIDNMNDKLPIMVGGSGLYIDSVVRDYHFDEEKRDDDSKYDDLSNDELYDILLKKDVDLANKIHKNNRKRVIRAIELSNYPENKISRSNREVFVYDTLCIFLSDDREKLYNRINERVDKMINDGLVEEVKKIGINNFSITSKAAIGYKEIIDYLEGKISLEEAIELIKKNSRHYAKRQFTWFKNKTESIIINVDIDNFDNTIENAKNIITDFLTRD